MSRSIFWAIALTATLFATGCKKQAAPAPVAAAPAPAPAVEWTWGVATFSGSEEAGTNGSLNVSFSAKNVSSTGLMMGVVGLHIFDADGEKICGGKTSVDDKAAGGAVIEGKVEISCDYTTLPAEGALNGRVTAMYTVGDEDKQEKLKTSITFKR
jgi:hypothetical protein